MGPNRRTYLDLCLQFHSPRNTHVLSTYTRVYNRPAGFDLDVVLPPALSAVRVLQLLLRYPATDLITAVPDRCVRAFAAMWMTMFSSTPCSSSSLAAASSPCASGTAHRILASAHTTHLLAAPTRDL